MSLIKRLIALVQANPASVAAVAQVIASLIVARYHPSAKIAADVTAVVSAALGLGTALLTRPFRIQALSGLVNAAAVLVGAYASHLPSWAVAILGVFGAATYVARDHKTTTTLALRKAAARKGHPASPAAA